MRRSPSGLVHVLDGAPVHEGALLELLLADGTWLRGTYSWSGVAARWPGLRFELGGAPAGVQDSSRRPMAVMALPPQARLRRIQLAGGVAVAEARDRESG
jgi:hypothetical protein